MPLFGPRAAIWSSMAFFPGSAPWKYMSRMARFIHTSNGNASAWPSENSSTQSATFGPTPGNLSSSFLAAAVGMFLSVSSSYPSAIILALLLIYGAR